MAQGTSGQPSLLPDCGLTSNLRKRLGQVNLGTNYLNSENKPSPMAYIPTAYRPFLRGLYTWGNLRFKIGQVCTGTEMCVSKSIGLAYS